MAALTMSRLCGGGSRGVCAAPRGRIGIVGLIVEAASCVPALDVSLPMAMAGPSRYGFDGVSKDGDSDARNGKGMGAKRSDPDR